MNSKIVLVFVISLVIATMADMMEDPEIKAEVEKIKTKLCSKESRPTDQQWTDMEKCTEEHHKKYFEKMKETFKDCFEKCADTDNLKTNNESRDFGICHMCSDGFKQCKAEKIKEWKAKAGSGGKKEEYKQTEEYKEKMQKYKDKVKAKFECTRKALGME